MAHWIFLILPCEWGGGLGSSRVLESHRQNRCSRGAHNAKGSVGQRQQQRHTPECWCQPTPRSAECPCPSAALQPWGCQRGRHNQRHPNGKPSGCQRGSACPCGSSAGPMAHPGSRAAAIATLPTRNAAILHPLPPPHLAVLVEDGVPAVLVLAIGGPPLAALPRRLRQGQAHVSARPVGNGNAAAARCPPLHLVPAPPPPPSALTSKQACTATKLKSLRQPGPIILRRFRSAFTAFTASLLILAATRSVTLHMWGGAALRRVRVRAGCELFVKTFSSFLAPLTGRS